MAIVSGELWQECDKTVLYVSCCACGKYLDKIEGAEIPAYLDYVLRTGDKAYCEDCDTSQDDIIHPFVEEIFRELVRCPTADYYAL